MDSFITDYPEVGFSFELSEIKDNLEQLSTDIIEKLSLSTKASEQYEVLYSNFFTNDLAIERYSSLYRKMVNY